MLQCTIMQNPSTVQLSTRTKSTLSELKNFDAETFEQVIKRLIISFAEESDELLSKEDITQIEKSLKQIKEGKYVTSAQLKKKLGIE